MKITLSRSFLAACVTLLSSLATTQEGQAVEILSPFDHIIAIDLDPEKSASNYPGGEAPLNALDDNAGTKYLNFAKLNTGFIATPFFPTTVQSVRFSTANDAVARDPASWELYGTNDAVTSADNSLGDQENWSLITNSDLTLPEARGDNTTILNFGNSTAYSSYRVVFPTVKDANAANSMQIADVQLYDGMDAGGLSVFNVANAVIAVGLDAVPASDYPAGEAPRFLLDGTGPLGPDVTPDSSYPAAEGPGNVVDGTLAKYLNGAGEQSGFIVTPASGAAAVGSFTLTTANDAEPRDPASYELWGTNDPITSVDNGFGLNENWTILSSGALALPVDRDTVGPVVATGNSTAYSSYKMIFPTIKDNTQTGLMQLAEASFFTTADATGGNILAPGDSVLAIDETMVLETGNDTKYLNFGAENSGFIIAPAAGDSTINEFQITTANDFPERDPATWELYGTNDPLTSGDNSQGGEENWVLIDSGTFDDTQVPADRQATGATVAVGNTTEYASYRMVFPTIRDVNAEGANSLQVSGIQFFGDVTATPDADLDNDGDVDGKDFLAIQRANPALISTWQASYGSPLSAVGSVPEPTTCMLLVIGLIATSATGRSRASRVATS